MITRKYLCSPKLHSIWNFEIDWKKIWCHYLYSKWSPTVSEPLIDDANYLIFTIPHVLTLQDNVTFRLLIKNKKIFSLEKVRHYYRNQNNLILAGEININLIKFDIVYRQIKLVNLFYQECLDNCC